MDERTTSQPAFENVLAPARERARKDQQGPGGRDGSDDPAPTAAAPPSVSARRSLSKGDLPDPLKRIYVAEPAKFGGFIDYYAGTDAKVSAFRDHGSHFATDRTDPAIVRHLIEIARHRGWTTLEVRGSDEFRREVWREAAAEGLKVRGYRPTERDKVALADRGEVEVRPREPSPARARPEPGLEAGIEGRLTAAGRAPYRNQAGARETPFVRLERDGAAREIWGVRLPEALARWGAAIGDEVRIRRGEPERTETAPGEAIQAARPRANQWVIERAERFLAASPAAAARDPELRGAQSQLQVIETLARTRLQDGESRARVVREAKVLIAGALRNGAEFRVAEVEEVRRRDLTRRPLETQAPAPPERDGPERTRQR